MGTFPRFHEDKGREISVNTSRITDLPTPKSPPKRGLSNLTGYDIYCPSKASARRMSSGVVIFIFSSVPGTIYTG